LDSIASSAPSAFPKKTALRAAAEGAAVALAGFLIAGRIWSSPSEKRSLALGVAAAWAASSISVAWLLWARGREMRSFWWAFGGGMALRAAVLALLAIGGYRRESLSFETLLVSYVFALLALLLTLELRHLRIK
jgi:hypothetical protein